MPLPDTPSLQGDLFVRYIVDLPPSLSGEQKGAVAAAFPA